jgi:hypothetical protein
MLDRTQPIPPPRTSDGRLTIELLAVRAGNDAPPPLELLVEKRLGIVRRGLLEASRQARSGNREDAAVLVEKLAEDLQMLQSRVARAGEAAASPR